MSSNEGGWRRLHNEELHNVYASPIVIRVIKSKRMTREANVSYTGEMRQHTRFCSEHLDQRDHMEDLRIDGKITLEYILGKECGKAWIGCIWLRIGTSGGLL
jgi:hypothetical protein